MFVFLRSKREYKGFLQKYYKKTFSVLKLSVNFTPLKH